MKTTIDPDAQQRLRDYQTRLVEARDVENERESKHEIARSHLHALRLQLEGGEEVEPLEYATASATAEMGEVLLKAATKRRTQAERAARRSDLDVAQAVADGLGDTYSCNATITDRLPSEFNKRGLPHLFIIQAQPTGHAGQGFIEGSARLVLAAADRMTTGPTAAQVSAKLERRGFGVGIVAKAPTEVTGGVWLNEFLISVGKGWCDFPKMVNRYDRPAPTLGSLALGDLINQAVFTFAAHRGPGPAPRMEVGWMVGPSEPAKEHADGRWTQDLTLGLALLPAHTDLPEQWDAAKSIAKAAIPRMVGGLIPGVGTILEATTGAKPFDLNKPGTPTFAALRVGFRPDSDDLNA
jgi:hypothetical protein